MDAGFTGLKFDPFAHTNYFYGEDLASNLTLTAEQQDLAFNVSKAVREAVGSECDIMIETHAMLNYRVAVKMAERLAKLDITWYEEPAGPESSQTLRAMRERIPSDVAICVGERHYTRFGIVRCWKACVRRDHARHHPLRRTVRDEADGYDGGGLQRSDRPA